MRRFRKLKKRLSRLQADAIAEACMEKLRQVERVAPQDYGGWLPWHLLLVMRWGLEFGRGCPPWEPVTEPVLIELVNQVHELSADAQAHLFDEPFGVRKWMRVIAHQQFWVQRGIRPDELGRQWSLFGELPVDHQLVRQFYDRVGMGIRQYLVMCFVLWSYIQSAKGPLFFTPANAFVNTSLPPEAWTAFLDLLAVDLDHTRAFVGGGKVRNPRYQFAERSPFAQRPLIRVGGRYACASLRLLEEFLRNGLVTLLREIDPQSFGTLYGPVQEQHVRRGLEGVGFELVPESERRRTSQPGRLVADFVATRPTRTLIVESKGVEPGALAKVNPIAGVIENDLRAHVVEGVQQCAETAFELGLRPGEHRVFAVVVTRAEFYMSNGPWAWEEILAAEVRERLRKRELPVDILDADDVFVLSLEDFDFLVGTLRDPEQFLDFLERAALANRSADTARLFLWQHMDGPDAGPLMPVHVTAGLDALTASTVAAFKPS